MKEITFTELQALIPDRFARLTQNKKRTRESVYREYNDEKYTQLAGASSYAEALSQYQGPVRDIAVSRHGRFYVMPSNEAFAMREKLIVQALAPLMENVTTVIELGAGFGQMLEAIRQAFPNRSYIAGEFSPIARALGTRLLPHIRFAPFDFYDEEWQIFEKTRNALVLTFHAVEMVTDASVVAKKFAQHQDSISSVCLFEPVYPLEDTPVADSRRRYIESNDYCRNIFQSFTPEEIDLDFFGLNPLFPESYLTVRYPR